MRGWLWKQKPNFQPSDDLEVLSGWLEQFPECNWALVPLRVLVLDVDTKDGALGPQSILDAGGGMELESNFVVRTPSHGMHYYFAGTDSIPFITKNKWLPGVDIRYGDNGYVVLPYSKLKCLGYYQPLLDFHVPCLTPVPDWINTRLQGDQNNVPDLAKHQLHNTEKTSTLASFVNESLNKKCIIQECDTWTGIRDWVRFLFFRKPANGRIWRHQPLRSMKDRTPSAYEYQLGMRLMNVGASDQEVLVAYRVWCAKHGFKIKKRFLTHVMPGAEVETLLCSTAEEFAQN